MGVAGAVGETPSLTGELVGETPRNRNRFTEMEITWRVIVGEEKGREWGKRYRE